MNQKFIDENEFIEEAGDAEEYENSCCMNNDTSNSLEDHRLDEMKKKAAELVDLSNDTKKKASFSKRILVAGMFVTLFMCIVCIYIKIKYQTDVTELMAITIASFGTDGTYGGFYYWKEKNANRAKYAQQFVLLFADEYGVDAAIRISEVVLKD